MNEIIVNNLTKEYGAFKAISNISFEVQKGEIFGLIGPNGAGKSTTMRAIMNYIFPTNGKISIAGLDSVKDYLKVRNIVGYLPGEFTTYDNMTGLQYLSHILHLRNQYHKINYAKLLSKKFDLDLNKKAKNLSKGNKQKIGIIQAFCHDPEILIIDEPTSGLDPLKQQEFDELVLEFKSKGKTVFISSHVLPEVETLCDRVAIIKDGKIVAENTMSELKSLAINRYEIVFKNEISEQNFQNSIGVENIIKSGGKYIFDVKGDINKFLKEISSNEISSFKSIEPDLEDIFLSLYNKNNEEEYNAN
ncbi:MAG: ABC transporter ATP-binding protein [Chloroflexi bacterium]|nr:ABC transporter ATP-binding protein [Chloroflexota bacterium]